jgi:hypothetical protein
MVRRWLRRFDVTLGEGVKSVLGGICGVASDAAEVFGPAKVLLGLFVKIYKTYAAVKSKDEKLDAFVREVKSVEEHLSASRDAFQDASVDE